MSKLTRYYTIISMPLAVLAATITGNADAKTRASALPKHGLPAAKSAHPSQHKIAQRPTPPPSDHHVSRTPARNIVTSRTGHQVIASYPQTHSRPATRSTVSHGTVPPRAPKHAAPPAPAPGHNSNACTAEQVHNRVHAMVIALNGQIIVGAQDAHKNLFQASVTKVATIYVVLKMIEEGKLSLDTVVPVHRVQFVNSRGAPEPNKVIPDEVTRMKVRDLLLAARIMSSNIAAHSLAIAIEKADRRGRNFANIVYDYTSRLGMTSTYDDGPSRGAGYPTSHALSVQTTNGANEILLLEAFNSLPGDNSWLNAPTAQLAGFDAHNATVTFNVRTKILSQFTESPYYMRTSLKKSALGCQTGYADAGTIPVDIANVHISFFQAGYPSAAARDKDLMQQVNRIKQDLASGKISIPASIIESVPTQTIISSKTRPEQRSEALTATREENKSNYPFGGLVLLFGGVALYGSTLKRDRNQTIPVRVPSLG